MMLSSVEKYVYYLVEKKVHDLIENNSIDKLRIKCEKNWLIFKQDGNVILIILS